MNRGIRKSELFIADFDRQFRWYERVAGWEVAKRYLDAVDTTLKRLTELPDLGRLRHFPQPELQGLRSLVLARPFHHHVVFYRNKETDIEAWRLMHGARDMPRRLLERPGFETD
ncbi:MAG: type II toxin-antitoxin system RelE/ParE family toxin [Verrucomicrobiota bacterium]